MGLLLNFSKTAFVFRSSVTIADLQQSKHYLTEIINETIEVFQVRSEAFKHIGDSNIRFGLRFPMFLLKKIESRQMALQLLFCFMCYLFSTAALSQRNLSFISHRSYVCYSVSQSDNWLGTFLCQNGIAASNIGRHIGKRSHRRIRKIRYLTFHFMWKTALCGRRSAGDIRPSSLLTVM